MFNYERYPGHIVARDLSGFWENLFVFNRLMEEKNVYQVTRDFYFKDVEGGAHYTQRSNICEVVGGNINSEEFAYDDSASKLDPEAEMEKIVKSVQTAFKMKDKKVVRAARVFEIQNELLVVCHLKTTHGKLISITLVFYSTQYKNREELPAIEIEGYTEQKQNREGVFTVDVAYTNDRGWEYTTIPLLSENLDAYLDDNYSKEMIEESRRLFTVIKKKQFFGKTILLHGEPGTGKSFWIRGFAKQLSSSYEISLVPCWQEFFAGMSGYYNTIEDGSKPFLFIFEDSGEIFIKGDKQSEFTPILLNLTDGLLTSGREDIFLFSFNQKIKELNEALVRPGRCLSAMYCGLLDVEKANAFLKKHKCDKEVDEPKTLGDLYAIAYGMKDKMTDEAKAALGFSPTVGVKKNG